MKLKLANFLQLLKNCQRSTQCPMKHTVKVWNMGREESKEVERGERYVVESEALWEADRLSASRQEHRQSEPIVEQSDENHHWSEVHDKNPRIERINPQYDAHPNWLARTRRHSYSWRYGVVVRHCFLVTLLFD